MTDDTLPTSTLRPDDPALAAIVTPALVIDATLLDDNIARMAARAKAAGVALRPHAKTHKSPDIAKRQRDAGAIGIACATLAEAEAMAEAGLTDLFITSPVVGADKVTRLMDLHARCTVIVVADHPDQVAAFAAAAKGNQALSLAIDIDVGQRRTGVASVADGVALAQRIAQEPALRLAAIQGYAGHVQHIVAAPERRAAAMESAETLRALADALRADGVAIDIVSGSGTGASGFDMTTGPYTEMQAGSYVFMDADYGKIREEDGAGLPFAHSLFVLATVVSASHSTQVTIDAGTKALAVNGPAPDRFIGLPDGSSYAFAGDEHGIITLPAGAARPAMGARVLVCASHCDPTVNLHAAYHAVAADGRVMRWPIVGRYQA